MPQSIIVYRNPLEAAFWSMLMDSPYVFPIIVAVVVFIVGVWLFSVLNTKVRLVSWKYEGYVSLVAGAAIAVATFLLLT